MNKNINNTELKEKDAPRNFWLSSFSIKNRTTVVLLMLLLLVAGAGAYQSMPKENFPEISIPTIYVGMTYAGNSPLDMENLITRHVEKEINTITGISKIKSTIIQDYSTTIVEFDFDTDVTEALTKVKDAVDKIRGDLPSDMDVEPNIFEMDFSSVPVININVYGERYTLEELNDYAETLEDRIENLTEISKVEVRGAEQKEVKIEVDKNKMEGLEISFRDIEDAIGYENKTISAGDLLVNKNRRSIRIVGEFQKPKSITEPSIEEQIGNIIIKNQFQEIVKLRDVATVKFEAKEADSYARIFGNPVISLDVMKASGENLLDAVAEIKKIVTKAKGEFPNDLSVTITNDTSKQTESMLSNLQNSIISGVILVVLVLLFFLGLRNALFVGVAIPMSMVISFMVLNFMGVTLNMMVLFSLVLALGMLVDNGIVVVENIYRILEEGKDLITASKEGVGEVAIPIIASTATTLAAFIPLIFWDGIMGEFMKYLPITLIIVLTSSLFVALVINPVLTSFFMRVQDLNKSNKPKWKFWLILAVVTVLFLAVSIIGYTTGNYNVVLLGNLVLLLVIITVLNVFLLEPLSKLFQTKFLVVLENAYSKFVAWALKGITPILLILFNFALFVGTIAYFASSQPKVEFFPETSPAYANVLIDFPTGTDIEKTNKTLREVEQRLIKGLEKYGLGGEDGHIEAILTNIGTGTVDPNSGRAGEDAGVKPNAAKITVSFVEYELRDKGPHEKLDAFAALKEIEELVGEIPGAIVSIGKPPAGPPTGPPINIAISGLDYTELLKVQDQVRTLIKKSGVQGIDELKSDLDSGKPELILTIDRDAARTYGLSTAQIAGDLRTALFGKEVSKYKEGDDDYPIMLRLQDDQRYNLETLRNVIITYRDQADGRIKQIPVSAIANIEYSNSIGQVRSVDLDRVVTLYSNLTDGFNANEIIAELKPMIDEQIVPNLKDGYSIEFTGEQEEQAKSMAFLGKALLIAVFVIFMIIVMQFNSLTTPIIIMISIVLSTIGVFLGLSIFGDSFVVIMTMIGIISLAGVVVNNAIVLIDFTFLTRDRIMEEKGYTDPNQMSRAEITEALVTAGRTRLRPVLLTAITTVLGLIPLAIGFNVNFYTLITQFDGQFYMGGDNMLMWGPLSWTVIYGLTFATFLTLVIVPVLILIFDRMSYRLSRLFK